jgi:LacI family transcriptional regulator
MEKENVNNINGLPRLKDIAERANVSIAATSIILSKDNNRFSQKTCDKVRKIAQELGWHKNLLANGIQSGKTKTIGVLIGPADSYYNEILLGIHKKLADADYVPITLWADMYEDDLLSTDNGFKQIDRLIGRRVDGLILRPTVAVAYEAHFERIISLKIPVVVIDHELKSAQLADTIETDEELGARLLADHLCKLGHKKFIFVSLQNFSRYSFAVRRESFLKFALSTYHNVDLQSMPLTQNYDESFAMLKNIMDSEDRPTAICCVADVIAKDVYQMVSDLGLKIPEDISITGFSDCDFAPLMHPPLTTIHQRPNEIGRHAAKLIIDRTTNKLEGVYGHVIKVGCDLTIRQSTAAPIVIT